MHASAVHPDDMSRILEVACATLRPGGVLYAQDYDLYDMTMLRSPPRQRLADRLYQGCALRILLSAVHLRSDAPMERCEVLECFAITHVLQ